MSECIHGLEKGHCDLCYPKPKPDEASLPVKAVRRSTRAPRKSTAPPTPPVSVREHRIFHVTHMRNLAGIIETGKLLADAHGAAPAVDISSPGNREERREAAVDTNKVSQFVPFFATPESDFWQGMRAGVPDPRLSPELREMSPTDFVILVSTLGAAGRENLVLAHGDAADADTTFAIDPDDAERELRRLFAPAGDGDEPAELAVAELLVWESFPFESISLIGVANNKARDEVKAVLQSAGASTKVAVHPPWFAKA